MSVKYFDFIPKTKFRCFQHELTWIHKFFCMEIQTLQSNGYDFCLVRMFETCAGGREYEIFYMWSWDNNFPWHLLDSQLNHVDYAEIQSEGYYLATIGTDHDFDLNEEYLILDEFVKFVSLDEIEVEDVDLP